ncbi:hypothetical protein OQA88_12504 [Cercophora sp. LCS_1]
MSQPPQRPTPIQAWTLSGYPIVDGKYHDLRTGEIKPHAEGIDFVTGGPPSLSVYWHNKNPKPGQEQPFYALSGSSPLSVSEYLVRVGDLLRAGVYTVDSVSATKYSVNLIIITQLSCQEFKEAMGRHGLLHGWAA